MARRWMGILIALALLAYGLMRLVIGSGLLIHTLGWIDISGLQEPMDDVVSFLEDKRDRTIIPISAAGYAGYIALMGLTLSAGGVGSIMGKRFGLPLIAAFLGLYALLFLNFRTINPKIVHLAVCTVLFLLLYWIKRGAAPRALSAR